jgi:hypothetical protein
MLAFFHNVDRSAWRGGHASPVRVVLELHRQQDHAVRSVVDNQRMCVRTVKVGSLVQYGYACFNLRCIHHTDGSIQLTAMDGSMEHGRSIKCTEATSLLTFRDDDRTILMTR